MPWLCLDKWLILGKSIFSEVLFYCNIIRTFEFSYFNFSFFGSHLEIFATFFCVYSFRLKNNTYICRKNLKLKIMINQKENFRIEPYNQCFEPNRYIIVDENGYDVNGEYYTLEEAELEIKFLTEENN